MLAFKNFTCELLIYTLEKLLVLPQQSVMQ